MQDRIGNFTSAGVSVLYGAGEQSRQEKTRSVSNCCEARLEKLRTFVHTSIYRSHMQIALRAARAEDFEYCRRLYFAGMSAIIETLNLNMAAQVSGLSEQWDLEQVRIITFNGSDVGWLQSATRDGAVFIAQLFVDGPYQRRGIGTEVVNRVIADANRANQPVCLAVVKINPAVGLYKRLGFHVMHEDDRKFYMRRDTDHE